MRVRCTDNLKRSFTYCVYLEPCGLQIKPNNLKQLLQALICVLTALKVGCHFFWELVTLYDDIAYYYYNVCICKPGFTRS